MASDDDTLNAKTGQMFYHLVEAGQWERVLQMGPEMLARDPEDVDIHTNMAVAALNLDRLKIARLHSDAAMRLAPEEGFTRLLMSRIWTRENRLLNAKKELIEALRLEPENTEHLLEYGWNCYRRGDPDAALAAAEEARKCSPENANVENLFAAARAHSNSADSSRHDAFAQIEDFEEALRFEPENDAIMHNIGRIYLDRLDDGVNAEDWFRRAVQIDPSAQHHRKGLHQALRRRDPFLRIVNSPVHLAKRGAYLGEIWYQKKWPLLIAAPLVPVIFALALAALAVWAIFLFLPGKIYEALTRAEMIGKITGSRTRTRFPFWLRIGLALTASAILISGLFKLLTHPDFKEVIGDVVSWGMVLFFIGLLWWSARRTE